MIFVSGHIDFNSCFRLPITSGEGNEDCFKNDPSTASVPREIAHLTLVNLLFAVHRKAAGRAIAEQSRLAARTQFCPCNLPRTRDDQVKEAHWSSRTVSRRIGSPTTRAGTQPLDRNAEAQQAGG